MHPDRERIQRTRREFFTTTASGLGMMALGAMLSDEGILGPSRAEAEGAGGGKGRQEERGGLVAEIERFKELEEQRRIEEEARLAREEEERKRREEEERLAAMSKGKKKKGKGKKKK